MGLNISREKPVDDQTPEELIVAICINSEDLGRRESGLSATGGVLLPDTAELLADRGREYEEIRARRDAQVRRLRECLSHPLSKSKKQPRWLSNP